MATNPLDFSGTNPVRSPSASDVFNAGNDAISFKEQLPDLSQKLREALMSKFSESPLFKQRETASQQFLAAPDQIRADLSTMQKTSGVPLSPTQQQAITSGRRAAAYVPLSTANLLLDTSLGGMNDIVGSGVKAFEAASNAQGERANLMQKMRQQAIENNFKQQGIDIDWAKLKASQEKTSVKGLDKQMEAAGLLKTQLEKITAIKSLIASGKAPTGFLPGLAFQVKKRFGGTTNQEAQLETAYSDFNTRLFSIAGKAFTGPERDLLAGMLLSKGNAPDYTSGQLGQIEDLLKQEQYRQAQQFFMEE